MKKKFKDIRVDEVFFGWGDLVSNYDFPKACEFKKVNDSTAMDVTDGNTSTGMLVCIDERDDYDVIGRVCKESGKIIYAKKQ